jgi:hypothetical protein
MEQNYYKISRKKAGCQDWEERKFRETGENSKGKLAIYCIQLQGPMKKEKALMTKFHEGFSMQDKDILLLVALCAGGCVLDTKSLGAVVAGTAGLAGLHVLHGHDLGTFLHLEETGLMAISTLVAFVSVNLAVENHFAGALAIVLYGLAARNCESRNGKSERYNNCNRYDEKLFHSDFTSFHRGLT